MMPTVQCVVVDDDLLSRKVLEQFIQHLDQWHLVASCTNALDARQTLQREKIDVLFLDIEMELVSGLELLRMIKNPPQVILVSSKEKYAVDAFEFEVADYLLKPVALDRFLKAIARVEHQLAKKLNTHAESDSIFVKANNQIMSVKLADIQWIEALGDYVNIFTGKERLVIHGTMKGVQSRLPANDFIRVHRSFIVRIDKIESIDESLITINKKLIPVGDSFRPNLMAHLNFL